MTKENYRQVIVGMLAVVLCYTFGFSFLGSLTILLCYALCYALRRRLSGKTYKNWRGDYCKPVFLGCGLCFIWRHCCVVAFTLRL